MSIKAKRYESDAVDVTYDARRCLHAGECVNGLSAVFNVGKRPWIQPGEAPAETVANVVLRCPTGALKFERKDGGPAEAPAPHNRIVPVVNGPLYIRGDVKIVDSDEAVLLADTRVALCRCGASANKPLCDNAHKEISFEASSQVEDNQAEVTAVPSHSPLQINPLSNGPLLLNGDFEILSADGRSLFRGNKAALCRCGGSSNKPFCDGTHKEIGFTDE